MSFFSNLFPYTNFHDLNLDWIVNSIKNLLNTQVKTVNNSYPDANGNINLPGVAGVSSVNGIGPDSSGNVQIPPMQSTKTDMDNYLNPAISDFFLASMYQYGKVVTLHFVFTTPSGGLDWSVICNNIPYTKGNSILTFSAYDYDNDVAYRCRVFDHKLETNEQVPGGIELTLCVTYISD